VTGGFPARKTTPKKKKSLIALHAGPAEKIDQHAKKKSSPGGDGQFLM
jgi:hypothetical protein